MKHENSKSEFIRRLAQQHGTNHSTKFFVDKCRALGVDVSPALAHACLGPYRWRELQDSKAVKDAARTLMALCDDDTTMAVRCLKIYG